MDVKFIEAVSNQDILPAIRQNSSKIKYKKIGLVSPIQHVITLKKIKKYLEEEGKQIYMVKGSSNCKYSGQVLGCDVSSALKLEKNIECFLYVGTGKFHPLGISFKTKKPVFSLDPYTLQLKKISSSEKKKYQQKRIINLHKVKEAKNIGILVSVKPGQYNLEAAEKLKNTLKKEKKNVFIFLFETLNILELLNFNWIDAWINTACPRIVEDDFNKPIINASEY